MPGHGTQVWLMEEKQSWVGMGGSGTICIIAKMYARKGNCLYWILLWEDMLSGTTITIL